MNERLLSDIVPCMMLPPVSPPKAALHQIDWREHLPANDGASEVRGVLVHEVEAALGVFLFFLLERKTWGKL